MGAFVPYISSHANHVQPDWSYLGISNPIPSSGRDLSHVTGRQIVKVREGDCCRMKDVRRCSCNVHAWGYMDISELDGR